MNMVEKVARAMAARDSGPEGSSLFKTHWGEFGDGYKESARTAIEAMREPTEQMVLPGFDALMELDARTGEDYGIESIWRAMIDAALSEKE